MRTGADDLASHTRLDKHHAAVDGLRIRNRLVSRNLEEIHPHGPPRRVYAFGMPNVGPMELIIVLAVVLLLFGSTKLPKLARSIGEASQEFKKGVSDGAGTDTKVAGQGPKPSDRVTMTQAELDALLTEREAQARKSPDLS